MALQGLRTWKGGIQKWRAGGNSMQPQGFGTWRCHGNANGILEEILNEIDVASAENSLVFSSLWLDMLKNILCSVLLVAFHNETGGIRHFQHTFGDQTLILHCHLSNVQNWLMTFHYTDRFVGILTMARKNPYTTRYYPLYIQETSRVSVTAHFKTWASTVKATICPGKKEPRKIEIWRP